MNVNNIDKLVRKLATRYNVDLNSVDLVCKTMTQYGEPKTGNLIHVRFRETHALIDAYVCDKPVFFEKVEY